MTVNTNSQFVLFLYSESETPPGSLKRLGSARQLPADLRALQNPLNTTFNPEGIYVWFPTSHPNTFYFSYSSRPWRFIFVIILLPVHTTEKIPPRWLDVQSIKPRSDLSSWMYAKLSPDPKLRKASPWIWPLLISYRKDAASVYVLPIDLLMQVRENSIMMSFFQECLWISR